MCASLRTCAPTAPILPSLIQDLSTALTLLINCRSGLGYVFSAALPPYLATAATAAIERIEREALGAAATANARRLRGLLQHLPGVCSVSS